MIKSVGAGGNAVVSIEETIYRLMPLDLSSGTASITSSLKGPILKMRSRS